MATTAAPITLLTLTSAEATDETRLAIVMDAVSATFGGPGKDHEAAFRVSEVLLQSEGVERHHGKLVDTISNAKKLLEMLRGKSLSGGSEPTAPLDFT